MTTFLKDPTGCQETDPKFFIVKASLVKVKDSTKNGGKKWETCSKDLQMKTMLRALLWDREGRINYRAESQLKIPNLASFCYSLCLQETYRGKKIPPPRTLSTSPVPPTSPASSRQRRVVSWPCFMRPGVATVNDWSQSIRWGLWEGKFCRYD